MSAHPNFDAVLAKVADGEAVDWSREAESTPTGADRELLQQLRILEKVAEAHRSEPDPAAATGPADPSSQSVGKDVVTVVPRHWGRYRLVGRLGQGGFGEVHLARDDELERDVAIKLLYPSKVGPELKRQVRQEGRALAKVRHANVLTVYDVEEHGEQLGLCMEYVNGRTLDALVRDDGPLNAGEAVVIGQAVCRALAALHQAGILHRDVKSRNVMRERAGRIVLMDLGAGLELQPQGEGAVSETVGTPVYMAPELLEGGRPTPQSDIYAAGVLLYFLVTGQYPISASTFGELREAHRQARRTRLDERRLDLPDAFVRLVERATAAQPDRRPESATAMLRELGEVEPHAVPAPGAGRSRGARLALLATVGLLAVAAFSGLVASFAFNRVLDRPGRFDPDGLVDKVTLGFNALVLPIVVAGVLTGAAAALNLVLKLVPWPRRWLGGWLDRLSVRPEERASVLARLVVLGGFLGFAAVWVEFGDVFYGLTNSLSESDLARFSLWRPENETRGLAFRLAMPTLLVAVAVGWKRVEQVRLMDGGTLPASLKAAALVLALLLVVFVQAPYKLMTHNKLEVGIVDGQRCYVLGRSGDETRVFCPATAVPRVRSVTAPATVQPCGFEENLFVASAATGCARTP